MITKIEINGTEYDIGGTYESPHLYTGRLLSEYTWAQLKTKCQNADFSDLRIGDYLTITLTNGEVIHAYIIGIDNYYNPLSPNYPHHIDFITDYFISSIWTSMNNNGNSEFECPWDRSAVKANCEKIYNEKMPTELTSIMKNKFMHLETRYSSSGVLSNSIGYTLKSMGYIWIPSEYEVFGSIIRGNFQSGIDAIQYPFFANNKKNRIIKSTNTGLPISWWLNSAEKDSSSSACIVTENGAAGSSYVQAGTSFTPSFRIG